MTAREDVGRTGPPARVSVGVDAEGRPVTVKHASGAAAARVVREADALVAARHPGVVELVDRTVTPDGVTLRTRHAGSRTAATCGALPVEEVAGLVAALAGTVADLHAAGIAHGRITPDHVVVSGSGRPVLCGFAEARLSVHGAAQADDVRGIGDVLTALLVRTDDEPAVPDRRPRWRAERGSATRRALLTLADHATGADPARRPSARQLAAAIHDVVPGARLPAAAPADGVPADHLLSLRPGHPARRAAVGGHRDRPPARPPTRSDRPPLGPDRPEPSGPDTGDGPAPTAGRHTRHGRRSGGPEIGAPPARAPLAAATAVAALVAVTAIAALTIGPLGGRADAPDARDAPSADQAASATPPRPPSSPPDLSADLAGTDLLDGPLVTDPSQGTPISAPADDAPRTGLDAVAGCATAPDGSSSTADGSPCAAPLRIDGQILEVADLRFDLGAAAAAVAVGDWACDGTTSAVVLAADRDQLVAFDGWATADRTVTGRPLTPVADARRLVAEPAGPPGCHRLVVLDGWGIRHLADPVTP